MGRHGLTTAGILSSTKILLADSMRKGPSCLPGLVLIGDQIPVMDPLSGLGLDMSIRSGIHSARAICRGFDCGRFDFTPRMNRFRKEVERDFRVADRIASVLFSQPRRFLEALRAQPKRLEELALRVMGYRSYSSLDRPIFRTPFERFLRTLRRK